MMGRCHYPLILLLTSFILFTAIPAHAEPKPGDVLGQENWQAAKGLMPDPILRRFEDGSYRAKVVTLPNTLAWGSKFTAASKANADKFVVDSEGFLIEKAAQTYPPFLYGYPFPQIN